MYRYTIGFCLMVLQHSRKPRTALATSIPVVTAGLKQPPEPWAGIHQPLGTANAKAVELVLACMFRGASPIQKREAQHESVQQLRESRLPRAKACR